MPVDQILGCFKTLVEEIQFRGQPVKLILNKFKNRDCGEKKIKVTFKRHGTKNLTGHLFSERNSYFRFVHTELTNRVEFQLFLGTRTVLVVLVRVALSSGTGRKRGLGERDCGVTICTCTERYFSNSKMAHPS